MRYRTQGMTMHTPAGWVDLVPLYRHLAGEKATVHTDEREAAVLALVHLGMEPYRAGNFLNFSHKTVRSILRTHGVKAESSKPQPFQEISEKALRRQALRRERELVGRRLVHPRAPHGTDHGYTEYGCQCEPCSSAHAVKLTEYRARKARSAA